MTTNRQGNIKQDDVKYGNPDDLLAEAIHVASGYYLNHQGVTNSSSLAEELTSFLYQEWYMRSTPDKATKHLPHASWAEVFRAVHPGTYQWKSGWRVESVSSTGRVIASRNEQQRVFQSGDYICPSRPGLAVVPGAVIEVVARNDSTEQMPGYWVSYSSCWQNAQHPMLRIYWNVTPEGAVKLASLLPQHLSDETPYSFKLPVEMQSYQRADSAVLYFEAKNYEQIKRVLKEVISLMKNDLYPAIPALTKGLEAGVALAEEPPAGNESFGWNRCRLIAEAYLATALMSGEAENANNSTKLEAVNTYLLEAGLNINQAHLNPGSMNNYEW